MSLENQYLDAIEDAERELAFEIKVTRFLISSWIVCLGLCITAGCMSSWGWMPGLNLTIGVIGGLGLAAFTIANLVWFFVASDNGGNTAADRLVKAQRAHRDFLLRDQG